MIFERFKRHKGQEMAAHENENKTSYGMGDAGFSLVEVIISMVILALISIPLLGYFTNSAKYNSLMATQQRATALAQQIVEDMKEQTDLIQDTRDDTGNLTDIQSGYLDGLGYIPTKYTTSTKNTEGSVTTYGSVVYNGKASDIGENYDVKVTFTDTNDNNTDVYEIPNMDSDTDVIALDLDQNNSSAVSYFMALNAMWASSGGEGDSRTAASKEDVESRLQRTITVLIQQSSGHYHVTVSSTYTCDGLNGADGETYEASDLADSYVNELGKIYVMFYANVNSTGAINDEVIIENLASTDCSPDIILACQNLGDVDKERYVMAVGGKDSADSDTFVIGMSSVAGTIRTNLARLYSLYTDGTLGSADSFDYSALTDKEEETRRVNIEVSVYKKGTMDTSDEKKYITLDATYDM
ncbi:MAG: prepilin-type N-terminal cleavage/methylation domain-containing protein [Clostridiales bacterium]|nr:prepilin-type N-terminal cleavage/methylation domain-containing protein [Clostridiales bacterium]